METFVLSTIVNLVIVVVVFYAYATWALRKGLMSSGPRNGTRAIVALVVLGVLAFASAHVGGLAAFLGLPASLVLLYVWFRYKPLECLRKKK